MMKTSLFSWEKRHSYMKFCIKLRESHDIWNVDLRLKIKNLELLKLSILMNIFDLNGSYLKI